MKNPYVLSYLALRKIVGFLGITFPVILILGAVAFGACKGFQDSISDYHNTSMRDVFVGLLSAIPLFLFMYVAYDDIKDKIAAKVAGITGFMVAIFPDEIDKNECAIQVLQNIPQWMATVHFISATIFFLTLAYFSIFLFTKSNQLKKDQTPAKKKRNLIYRVCGYIMIACILFLLLYFKVPVIKANLPQFTVLFLETIALWAFGFSWIVKGEAIIKG